MRMRRQPFLLPHSLPLPLPWFFSCETPYSYSVGFPGGSVVKNPPALQEMTVQSLGQEDPLEEEMATHSSILTWEIPVDRGAWWGTDHRVAKEKEHNLATKQHSCSIKGESQKSGGVPPFPILVLNVQSTCAWWSLVHPPVSPCASSPCFSCLASVSVWVCLWFLSVPQQWQKSLPLLSCVSSLSFGGGSVGRCDSRVALLWKDKREKSQMRFLPVR